MEVKLLHHSPISVVIAAIRKCYASEGLSDSRVVGGEFILGIRDKELVRRIVSAGHGSVTEMAVYTFDIDGISRGCLQELARHRLASLAVRSSRYTLTKMLKDVDSFYYSDGEINLEVVDNYLVLSGDTYVDAASVMALDYVRVGTNLGIANDILKYCLPESLKTSLIWTINARSLRNFLELRLDKRAHWEIQALANQILTLIPKDHKILFEGINYLP